MDTDNVLRFVVVDPSGKEITTTRENLRMPTNSDIGWIPSSIPEYNSSRKCLTDAQIKYLCSPTHPSLLQQELLSLHHKLFHLMFSMMLRISKFGIFPKYFSSRGIICPLVPPACSDKRTGNFGGTSRL